MKIKKGDFVELDYVGRIKEDGRIFDLTSEDLAKKEGIHQEHGQYGAKIICVGEGTLVKGIDIFLEGKDAKTYTLSLPPEEAFGKKHAQLIKIVPIHIFKKQQIKPFPGLQFNMDGAIGTVKTVSGGRVIVDFNHPLAGRDVEYEITVKRLVTKPEEKIKAYLQMLFGREVTYTFTKGTLTIDFPLPDQAQQQVQEKMKHVLTDVKKIVFQKPQESTKKTSIQP
jgi:FKBP-type peptidyl-prolyl cis-trans isomerase 2